ncbi:MAG TPA: zf-HC2 domain-containing protein [Gemmatimonadaceae bacterium]|jgi:anti-sigma factor (TIGR02949 family)|nr:zf-HC2 domain-containing protein [Gemmatimonadaceae bacterium]
MTRDDTATSLTCAQAIEKIYEYLDGELTPQVEEGIRAHLAICRKCYPNFRHEEVFLRFLEQRARLEKAPPELRRRIMQMLMDEEAAREPE